MKSIKHQKALELINKIKASGKFFTVTFKKRTTGELRTMTCRGGVSKHVTGEGLKFDPAKKNLVPVFEVNNQEGKTGKDAYRFISLESVLFISSEGADYRVKA
jgi:hypothetical protein